MAGKNEVTLTFAGDSRALSTELDKVTAGTKKTEEAFDQLGKGAADGLAKVGDSAKVSGDKVRKSSKETEEYASRLDRAGESADGAETRFTGLASGIDGVTTLMADPSPQEFAQGIADISDGVANSFVPALTKAKDLAGSMIEKLGGMKQAAFLAGGAAGLAAVGVGLVALSKAQHEEAISKATEAFIELDGQVNTNSKSMVYAAQQTGNLDDMMGRIIETSPRVAFNILENADALGISSEEADRYRGELEKVFTAQDNVAASIRDTTNAMRAQSDPFFALIDADQQMAAASRAVADAEAAVTEARKEHGAQSTEAVVAEENLTAARLAEGEALYGQEAAVRELAASMLESGASVDDVITHLAGLAEQGGVSRETVDAVSDALRGVPRRTEAVLSAHDVASRSIDGVSVALAALNGDQATVTIHANVTAAASRAIAALNSAMFAEGGVVPQYLASGGMGGPRGTDTVPAWLTPGEMVLNAGQQAELWGMANGKGGGGGMTVVVNAPLISSVRELEGMIHDAMRRGGFR